jgi:hypothetical protein
MPPGTDFTRVVARAVRGDCSFAPVTVTPPPGGGGPPGGGPGADTTAPVITDARIRPSRFLAGRRMRKRTAERPPIGGRLRFTLSEAASVELRFARLKKGRRLDGHCVAPRRAPEGRRCPRALRRGKLSRAGMAGPNRIAITGRLRGRKLAPGRYRITIVTADEAGNAGKRVRVPSTILRPL